MSNKIYTNPWAGLSSYQDPESADVQLKFCGRDNESFDVAQLIDDNIFVTLYGKSGTGKTSLLNAGVFPRLRQEQYLPVSIRLGMEAFDISFQQCVLSKISQALQGKGTQTTVEVVPMPADEQSTEYLWSYFARTRFMAVNGSALFPVLVFDQFEEVFRNRRDEAETLLRQIHFMMDENHALSDRLVDGQPYQYDFNFRFVVSIREDDLYRLEDSIDNCYLPELKRCRYRLRSLSEQGASDVILIPGEGLFKSEEQKDIVDKIVGKSRNEDGSISTNIISLLCSRIYADFLRSGVDNISPAIVDSFLKGNPFEKFYDEATRGFSNHEKSYIEERLVDSIGRRNSLPESDFLLHVKNGSALLDGERKILQRISTSSDGGDYRVELIHDSFCEPLAKQQEKREKWKRRRQMVGVMSIALLCLFVVAFVLFQMRQLKDANWKILESQSRFIEEKALSLTKEGDSYLARLLLLEILPKDINKPNRPRISESVSALAEVNKSNSAIFRIEDDNYKGYMNIYPVRCAVFSHDGKRIASESCNRIIEWDANNGKKLFDVVQNSLDTSCFHKSGIPIAFSNDGSFMVTVDAYYNSIIIIDSFDGKKKGSVIGKHEDEVLAVAISPDDNYIASSSIDGTIKLWNMQWFEGESFEGHKDIINTISFSPDSKHIVSASRDRTIRIWDIQKGKQMGVPIKGHTGGVNSAFYSPDGKYIVSASLDKTIRIWDVKTGKQIGKSICGHSEAVNSACFSSDGRFIVSASDDKTVRIWDVLTGKQIGKTLLGHTERVASARFSPDDRRIVSASDDKTIRIWDVDTTLFSNKNNHDANITINESTNNRIFLGHKDEKKRNWDNNSIQELINQTRERFKNRPLTLEERRKYYLE